MSYQLDFKVHMDEDPATTGPLDRQIVIDDTTMGAVMCLIVTAFMALQVLLRGTGADPTVASRVLVTKVS